MLDSEYQKQLDLVRDVLSQVTARFMAVQIIDEKKIEYLNPELERLVDMSKGKWLLPKDLIAALYNLYSMLADTEFATSPERQIELSKYYSKAFHCLLVDEGMNDRQPGVPRII